MRHSQKHVGFIGVRDLQVLRGSLHTLEIQYMPFSFQRMKLIMWAQKSRSD